MFVYIRYPVAFLEGFFFVFFQSCAGKCSQNKDCVQCLVFKSGPLTADECKSRCADFKINEVDELTPGESMLTLCKHLCVSRLAV